jgi:tripartite-type tricarboxylate transporter receptor subunit TctC
MAASARKALLAFLVFVLLPWQSATARASEEAFYRGKTVRIVVGYSPGGGFDTFARLVARYLGRHIPGEPTVIVQNMPGAGSLVAANWVYGQQPDGRTIVTFHFGLVTQALVGDPLVKFDPARFVWLGDPSIGGLPQVLWIRNDLPIRSVDDLRKREKPLALGVTGRAEGPAIAGEFLRYLGFPITNISGYKGSNDIMVALERNEVDGRIIGQSTMQMIYARYIQEGLVRPLLSLGKEPRLAPLSGVATLEDLNLNTGQRNLAEFLSRTWVALRPFALPPGVPAARVAALRNAFSQVLKDPQLIKEAERQGTEISPLSGEDLSQIVKELAAAPRDVVETYKTFIGLKN